MSTISSFRSREKKHDAYRGKDCMKKFFESLREYTKKKKNVVINKRAARIFYNCKEKFVNKYLNSKKHQKVTGHCYYTGYYRGAAQRICNLKYHVPKKMLILFHNGSNYDYHFIIKELAN